MRTALNDCPDGRQIKWWDPGSTRVEWELELSELSDSELQEIAELYDGVEGTLGAFTFLDPTGNLFSWSEDLDQPVWEKTGPLEVHQGVPDPLGNNRASRIGNTTAGILSVQQTLNAPAWFHYCFSVYARSDSGPRVSLFRQTASETHLLEQPLTPSWTRLIFPAQREDPNESLTFGLRLEPQTALEVYGLQVQAQFAPSRYRATSSASGVYKDAHFQNEVWAATTDGPGRHSCVLRIAARTT
ncbi:MAG: hypothetical protein WD696_16495 [Bryobacteraceae bacterium]